MTNAGALKASSLCISLAAPVPISRLHRLLCLLTLRCSRNGIIMWGKLEYNIGSRVSRIAPAHDHRQDDWTGA